VFNSYKIAESGYFEANTCSVVELRRLCFGAVLQEAVATGCPEMIQLVVERRDYERHSAWAAGVPELLRRLNEVSSFNNHYFLLNRIFTSQYLRL